MLIIRPEQVKVLKQYMVRQFENKMLVHLRRNFPNETKKLSEDKLRTFIQTGIKGAKGYNIKLEQDVQSYLEMIIIYGTDFDTNSKTAWAGKILRTQDMDGTTKMNLL